MNAFLFLFAAGAFFSALVAAGILYVIVAALIWHFLPNTRAGKWINDTHGEAVFVNVERSIEVGDCLKPNPSRKGCTWRKDDIKIGGEVLE